MGYFAKFGKSAGIPFMDNANKADIRDFFGKQLSLKDYGYINGDNGEYACVCFNEVSGCFFFMNTIFTEALQEIERDGRVEDFKKCGLVFSEQKSKQGRDYITFEVIEED